MEVMRKDYGPGYQERGAALLFQYELEKAPEGHNTFSNMRLVHYDSVTDFQTWEPARVKSLHMEPSLDDPWAELAVVKPLGAGYSVNSNWIPGVSTLAQLKKTRGQSDSIPVLGPLGLLHPRHHGPLPAVRAVLTFQEG